MSFKEQLLKAGLVTEDQIKATEAAERKEKEQRRQKRQAAEQRSQSKGKPKKPSKNRNKVSSAKGVNVDDIAYRPAKNPKKAAKSGTAARKAQLTAIKFLIKKHRMNTDAADQDYNFVSSNKIRKVRVTAAQSKALANGKLVLLRNPQDSFDYPILPIPIALEIAETERHVILVWNGSEGDKYWAAEEAAKAANQAAQQAQTDQTKASESGQPNEADGLASEHSDHADTNESVDTSVVSDSNSAEIVATDSDSVTPQDVMSSHQEVTTEEGAANV